ncbi:MAG: BON domain-containing protein [Deltaproteobacteria bacterium]|nr:BON domain-containing protein [Deltaproteobacteria bacterium]
MKRRERILMKAVDRMKNNHVLFILLVIPCVMGLTLTPVSGAKPLLNDIAISDSVEDELQLDSAVPSHRIDVNTIDGVVTLSGSVDNILAKERAARIARIVKGVRSVVNQIKVDPPLLRTDAEIREDVEEALLFDPATDGFEVDVTVQNNHATLRGSVDSWQERDLCEKVAKGVKGVKSVNNEIAVSWPEKRLDQEIQREVEKALMWDAFVDHALIDVTVTDGKVLLSGLVGSAAEKDWAYRDAFVHGVTSVDDTRLKVERWARDPDLKKEKYAKKSPEEIEGAVRDAFLYDPRVSAFKITPEVAEDGFTVILRGTVDNLKAKWAAGEDAQNTVGVLNVNNRIKVRPAGAPSDERIENSIRSALLRDPYLESYEIAVDVINGVANLYGTVDTYFEKSQADDVVSKVNGVIMVDNNLTVQGDTGVFIYDPYVDEWLVQDADWYRDRPRFPTRSDFRIKTDIEDEFFWSPFVDGDEVTVTVEDGVATLTGTVDSWLEYNASANNAYEGGAVYVDNDLTVKVP